MRLRLPANTKLLLVIISCFLVLGCNTTKRVENTTKGPPPPDLKARPWGVSQKFLQAVENDDQKKVEHLLVQSDQAQVTMGKVKGLKPSKEVVSGRDAKVWLVNDKNQTKGYLHFRKRTQGWLVESFVRDSGKRKKRRRSNK